MPSNHRSLGILVALALIGPAACEDGTGTGGTTTMHVLLTDAPSEYIEAAWVDIGAVQLVSGEHGIITLSDDGTDGLINLLDLRDAATEQLAVAEIEAGVYEQIRLIVEEARVLLKDGYEFRDGTTEKDLFVPSGAQTGIKLNLGVADGEEDGSGLEILPGELVLVLDFDVNQSFVIQGNPNTPAGIRGVSFKPTLRVTVEEFAASVAGTVSTALEAFDVTGLELVAEKQNDGATEEFQTETATATVREDGTYKLYFLTPGTYLVTVSLPGGFTTDPVDATLTVDAGDQEQAVDFEVISAS